VLSSLTVIMSVSYDLRVFHIRALQRAYAARQLDLPFLEERIEALHDVLAHARLPDALNLTPDEVAQHYHDIGVALYERYMHLREVKDLGQAETHLRLALPILSPTAFFPCPRSILGSVLRERVFETMSALIADEAVSLHREALLIYSNKPTLEKAHCLRELGMSLHMHHVASPNEDRVSEGIQLLRDAHAMFVELGVDDHLTALGLCNALCSLYEIRRSESRLNESILFGSRALSQCGPSHRDSYRAIRLLSHAQIGRAWFFNSDGPEYLDSVIDTLRTGQVHAPLLWKITLVDKFCSALMLRYVKQGNPEDLSESIERITEVLSSTLDPKDLHVVQLQARLSPALQLRFKLTGAPEDIEAAVQAAELAILHVNVGTSQHLQWLMVLAGGRGEQFAAFGDIAYLDQSIALYEQLMHSAPLQSTVWNMAASNLLQAFLLRYDVVAGDIGYLRKAVQLVPVFLAHREKQNSIGYIGLHNAGAVMLSQFENTGAAEDLDQATVLLKEAVEGYTRDSYDIYRRTGAYTKALRIRYGLFHERDSADRALHLHNELIQSLPATHPDQTRALSDWAHLQIVCANNISGALESLVHALDNDYCPAYRRLKEVSDVLMHLHKHERDFDNETATRLSNVYSKAISLLPQVASFGLEPHVRLSVIANAGALTSQGAMHAISNGELELALEMLESGRTVFWTQNLRLRTSFVDLPEDIGSRLTKITYALAQPMPDSASAGPGKDRELARRRQLGDEFRSVLAEARLVSGFGNLLQNTPFASLARAAARHPIVVLVADDSSGHAIIVQADAHCHLVSLLGANAKALQALSRRIATQSKHARSARGVRKVEAGVARATDVYEELWTLVMAPLVESLGWSVSLPV
jgi:tetratricopeptide (TPR) repeat protein